MFVLGFAHVLQIIDERRVGASRQVERNSNIWSKYCNEVYTVHVQYKYRIVLLENATEIRVFYSATGAFCQALRGETEMQLQERITRKLDEFFSLAAYDWLGPADGRAVNESPSPYMTDMTGFLAAQFKSYAGFLNVRTRHTVPILRSYTGPL